MREITVFHMEPEYLLGDLNNLITLKKKIATDSILLEKIKKDYNQNKKQYKNEYFTAKINHMSNKCLYYWLYIKRYFDQAIYTDSTTFPDYQKEEMKKNGWMFPQAFIHSRITTSGGVKISTEELYIRYFDKYFDNLFNINIGEKDSRIHRYYQQAIFNYKNKCYYSCAVSLFPIIESYHQFMNNFNENRFYKIKENLENLENKIENIHQIYNIKISYYINIVKQFNDLAKNHYFNISLDRTTEPNIINRNRIMHGLFTREISQKDCLQLFCVISNMIVIKNIIEANNKLNHVSEELKALKSLLNKQQS